MKHNTPYSPQEILERIVNSPRSVKYNYIIMGESGPTGKTWLYSKLKERGYNVTEMSEYIMGQVRYVKDVNSIIVNEFDSVIIIILNKPLDINKNI